MNQEERMYSSLDSNSSRLFEIDVARTLTNEERSMNFVGGAYIIGFFGCGIYMLTWE